MGGAGAREAEGPVEVFGGVAFGDVEFDAGAAGGFEELADGFDEGAAEALAACGRVGPDGAEVAGAVFAAATGDEADRVVAFERGERLEGAGAASGPGAPVGLGFGDGFLEGGAIRVGRVLEGAEAEVADYGPVGFVEGADLVGVGHGGIVRGLRTED